MPGINYQALFDLIKSGDPRGMQAAGNLTPQEQQEFFDFQRQQSIAQGKGSGETGRAESDTLAALPALGQAAGVLNMLPASVGRAATSGGKTLGMLGLYTVAQKAMDLMHVPREAQTAILVGQGLKGALSNPGAATVAGLSDAEVAALKAKGMDDALIQRLGQASKQAQVGGNVPGVGMPTVPTGPMAPQPVGGADVPFLNAQQFLQAQRLRQQGVDPDQIILRLTR